MPCKVTLPVAGARWVGSLLALILCCFGFYAFWFGAFSEYSHGLVGLMGRATSTVGVPVCGAALLFSIRDLRLGKGVAFSGEVVEKNSTYQPWCLAWSRVRGVRVYSVIGMSAVYVDYEGDDGEVLEKRVDLLRHYGGLEEEIKRVAPVPVRFFK